jgi:CxxC motif-containing protein (DUF1111 family)
MRILNLSLVAVALALAPGVARLEPDAEISDRERSGGQFTVSDSSESAYSHPASQLDARQAEAFALGRQMFTTRWAFFWFENAAFGRGPLSNAQACTTCHANNGRGVVEGTPRLASNGAAGVARDHHITVPFEPAPNLVVRVSIKGDGPHGGPLPHPRYGDQLQIFGVKGVVPAEGEFSVHWLEQVFALPDGEQLRLRMPVLTITNLGYEPLGADALTALRLAPPLVGLGLLEAVPQETILTLAARPAVAGIRGRANRVWDESQGKIVLGRFGLKANHGSLREQVAAAFINDIGLSNPVYPEQNCTPVQQTCAEQMVAGRPEITASRLAGTEMYVRALQVPARRNSQDAEVLRGEELFAKAHCAVCHLPELKTGPLPPLPQLAAQTIRPYTDLLLHDMGEGLADGRPDFLATGREWRTPPLWGIGLSKTVNGAGAFLHDGRARDFIEAILWHGGEAEASRDAFRGMPKRDRDALLAFLQSL